MTMFDDVGQFHNKFGLPSTTPQRVARLLDLEVWEYRLKFLMEELAETQDAYHRGNLAEFLDGLVDLAWVAMGTAHYAGLPFNAAWVEVARANMDKVHADTLCQCNERPHASDCPSSGHKRGPSEVIRKPLGWEAPRLREAIALHNRFARLNGKSSSDLEEKFKNVPPAVEVAMREVVSNELPPLQNGDTLMIEYGTNDVSNVEMNELDFARIFGGST